MMRRRLYKLREQTLLGLHIRQLPHPFNGVVQIAFTPGLQDG